MKVQLSNPIFPRPYLLRPAARSSTAPTEEVELTRLYSALEKADRLEPDWQVRLEGSFIGPDQRCANPTPILAADGSLYLGTATRFARVSAQGKLEWSSRQPEKHMILDSLAFGAERQSLALVHNYFEARQPGQIRGRQGTAIKILSASTGDSLGALKDINIETMRRAPDGSLWLATVTGDIHRLTSDGDDQLVREGADLNRFEGMLSDAGEYIFDLQPTEEGTFFTSNQGLRLIQYGETRQLSIDGATPYLKGLSPTRAGGVYCLSMRDSGVGLTRVDAHGKVEWSREISSGRGVIHTTTEDDGYAFADLDEKSGKVMFVKYGPQGEKEWSVEHPSVSSQGSGTMGTRTVQDWPDLTLTRGPDNSVVVLSRDLGLAAGFRDGQVAWSHQSPIEAHGRGLDIKPRPNYSVSADGRLWITLDGDLTCVDLKDGSVELAYDAGKGRFRAGGDTISLQGKPFKFLGGVIQGQDGRLISIDPEGNYAAVPLPLDLGEALEQTPSVDSEVDIEMGTDFVDVGGILLPYEI